MQAKTQSIQYNLIKKGSVVKKCHDDGIFCYHALNKVFLKVNIHFKHNMGLKFSKYIPVYLIMFNFYQNLHYKVIRTVAYSLLSWLGLASSGTGNTES